MPTNASEKIYSKYEQRLQSLSDQLEDIRMKRLVLSQGSFQADALLVLRMAFEYGRQSVKRGDE